MKVLILLNLQLLLLFINCNIEILILFHYFSVIFMIFQIYFQTIIQLENRNFPLLFSDQKFYVFRILFTIFRISSIYLKKNSNKTTKKFVKFIIIILILVLVIQHGKFYTFFRILTKIFMISVFTNNQLQFFN